MTKKSSSSSERPLPENTIIGIFDSHERAERAVKELQRSGYDMRNLSLVGKGIHEEEHPVGFYTTGQRIASWGGIGAFWGGVWGLLVGAAFFWIPGLGPIAVAGPFVHLLVSGLEGAALVGGIGAVGGALASLGVPRDSILKYERELKADKYLVLAHGTPEEVERARTIMAQIEATATELVAA